MIPDCSYLARGRKRVLKKELSSRKKPDPTGLDKVLTIHTAKGEKASLEDNIKGVPPNCEEENVCYLSHVVCGVSSEQLG